MSSFYLSETLQGSEVQDKQGPVWWWKSFVRKLCNSSSDTAR